MKFRSLITTITLLGSLTTAIQAQTTPAATSQKIGDYTIKTDVLKDNFCESIDQSKFHDVQNVDRLYISYVDKKLDTLKPPVRAFLEKKDFVSISGTSKIY
jgi:hypothetical protein